MRLSAAVLTACLASGQAFASVDASQRHQPYRDALSGAATSRLPPRSTGSDSDRGTVNAVNATLKYWWTTTNYVAASTVQILFNSNDTSTGWTIYKAYETFNTASAVLTTSCAPPYTTYTPIKGSPYTFSNCYTSPKHVAATTSILYVSAFKSPSVTAATSTPLPDLRITPPPAQVVLAAHTFPTGTPFVQFSEYEIVRCVDRRNGSCRATTQTHTLSSPYAFSYTGANPALASNVDAAVTGQLDQDFPAYINRTSLVPGSWIAPPTVIVVVDIILVAIAVLAASFAQPYVEHTASALLLPTPVLPVGYSALPQTNIAATTTNPIDNSPYVQVTQSWLLVPGTPTAATQPTKAQQELSTTIANMQPVVIAGVTLTPDRVAAYVADGKTAYQGGPAITIGSQTLSAVTSADALLIWSGSTTETVAANSLGVMTLDGMQITATSAIMYTGSDQTLIPGGSAVTVDGIAVSMPTSGSLQISTQAMARTSAAGIAPHIINGMGSGTSTSSEAIASQTDASASSPTSGSAPLGQTWWLTSCAAVALAWYVT